MTEIRELNMKLAERFCEDTKTFKVEECLDTFKIFCEKVKQCQHVSAVFIFKMYFLKDYSNYCTWV